MTRGHNRTGRSRNVPGGYVKLDGYMLDSEAWKALKPIARAVYIALKRRFRNRGEGKSNNGYISMSRREAAAQTGFSESAMRNAFPDLIEKGFIKVTRESSFNMKDTRAREHALTEFSIGDKLPTKEFLKWHPEKQNTGAQETPVTQIRRTKMGAKRPSRVRREHPLRGATGARMTPLLLTSIWLPAVVGRIDRAISNFGLSEIPFFLTGIESGARRTG